jgi:hypothetical protein
MKKLKAQNLLNTLNKGMSIEDINELYKAIIAYSLGLETIDEKKFSSIINFFYDASYILGFVNEDLINYAKDVLEEK